MTNCASRKDSCAISSSRKYDSSGKQGKGTRKSNKSKKKANTGTKTNPTTGGSSNNDKNNNDKTGARSSDETNSAYKESNRMLILSFCDILNHKSDLGGVEALTWIHQSTIEHARRIVHRMSKKAEEQKKTSEELYHQG